MYVDARLSVFHENVDFGNQMGHNTRPVTKEDACKTGRIFYDTAQQRRNKDKDDATRHVDS